MSQITGAKRPSEVVREYIEASFFQSDLPPETRLPTIHEFSVKLGVSPSTVGTVFKALAGEGKLRMIPGKGTFLTGKADGDGSAHQYCIGINLAMAPTASNWAGAILLGATQAAFEAGMTIMTLDAMRAPYPPLKTLQQALRKVDGVIAFPEASLSHEVDNVCQEKGTPLVHINPTRFTATANFVSNDYFGFAYRLANAWLRSGRRKIVLLMSCPASQSVSTAQLFSAFSLVFSQCDDAQLRVLQGNFSVAKETGYSLMSDDLKKNGKGAVDAVYGFGDLLAEGALQALLDAGLRVPEDVSLVSGTGLQPVRVETLEVVAMRQPMHEVGASAARMVIQHILNRTRDASGLYIMPDLGEGNTITDREREAFAQLLREDQQLV